MTLETLAGKYLAFALGEDEYCIETLKIKEIIGMLPIRPLPRGPDFIKGVINLRGKLMPVTDLRLKFGLPGTAVTERTCIIVVEIERPSSSLTMGLVVDGVSEVTNIKEEEIEMAPPLGLPEQIDFIAGVAQTGNHVRIILNIDRVLGEEQLAALGTML